MENQTEQQGNGQVPAPEAGAVATEKRNEDGVMIFLSYFGIFALIPYLTVKDSDYVRWHAKQGLTFLGAAIVLWIGLAILSAIPLINLLALILWPIAGIGMFVLWIICLIKAFGGERWKIPLVGDLADKW